jgi:cell division protein FtsL
MMIINIVYLIFALLFVYLFIKLRSYAQTIQDLRKCIRTQRNKIKNLKKHKKYLKNSNPPKLIPLQKNTN